jgi:4-hydroxybutyryl-CoA dehydratase / vinylacetyl-CoA-Delta-isomerase
MGLRTAEQYLESLRDGRIVYYRGDRVADVTTHPALSVGAQHTAIDFRLAENPAHGDLFVVADPSSGHETSRYFAIPRNGEDLLARRAVIETATREGRTTVPLVKEIGSDSLFAMMITCAEMGPAGAEYLRRVQQFYEHCRDGDLTMAVAQTDMKGDRSQRPHEQSNPDTYVRVVEERPGGIVVRGAKAHTTNAVYANEIIVIPTRAMSAEDRAYAVAFAVRPDTPGVRMLASPRGFGGKNAFDNPISSTTKMVESITIFDDVFVPHERVFLNGEWKAAGLLAKQFVEFHRYTAVSYKTPLLELLVGLAALLAEYNGIARTAHVRDKLVRLVMYLETVRSLTKAAAFGHRLRQGIAVPDVVSTNAAKYHFAAHYHDAVKMVQDIAGGLIVTAPVFEDWKDPAVRADLERFLTGAAGVTAEARLRAINLVRDVTASDLGGYLEVLAIHAEGSLETQKLTIMMDVALEPYMAYARQLAGIDQDNVLPV